MSKGREAVSSDVVFAEAKALSALWDDARKAQRIPPQAEAGSKYNIGGQGAVWQYLNGRRPLNLKAARGFAAALGVSIADFSVRLAEEADKIAKFATPSDDEYLSIPQMNGYVYGGSGHPAGHEEIIGQLKFRADFLRECGVTQSNGRIIKVRGNSMFPRIPDGSVVLVKTSDQEPVSGDIFAIAHPSLGPIIKRLRMANGLWYADSENPDHQPIPMQEENAKLIGRAVWMGAKL
jgi:phage repressor protein C with HTH and peptisase S24 domain